MKKTGISYLFPPDKINELPSWRFVLHFKTPRFFREKKSRLAVQALKDAQWKIITFPTGLEGLVYDAHNKTLAIPIEVPEDRRRREGSLSDYESDVWKIYGNMLSSGFGDLFYEAVDWKE